jgi:hypothetical protein
MARGRAAVVRDGERLASTRARRRSPPRRTRTTTRGASRAGPLRRGACGALERPLAGGARRVSRGATRGPRRGRHVREAIARILPVVERAGDYDWGWARLADWAEQGGHRRLGEGRRRSYAPPTDRRRSARQPRSRSGSDGARGKALFREALTHDPGYRYAAYQLLRSRTARDPAALSAPHPRSEGRPTVDRPRGPLASAALAGTPRGPGRGEGP